MRRRAAFVAGRRSVGAGLLLAATARPVAAHPVGGSRFDAPLPLSLLFGGAALTVAVTALWLAVTDRRPTQTTPNERFAVPAGVERTGLAVARSAFLLAVLSAISAGVTGRQVAAENFATVFTWPVWFRGVALVSILVGSPWSALSPWRAVHRGLTRLEGRPIALLEEYPRALGDWPALAGFLVLLGVLENLTVVPGSPRLTAVVVSVYALAMLAGALLFGDAWLRRADPLGVLYRLLGRVGAVGVSRSSGSTVVVTRAPWRGCSRPVGTLALAAFVVATVYTVSFDGVTSTRVFDDILAAARSTLPTGPTTPLVLYALGLCGFLATFVAASAAVERLGTGSGRPSWRAATRRFAPTVLPIAAAYEVAHYYPFVLRNLGQLWAVSLRPLLPGVEPVSPLGWLPLPAFWWSQVVLIVAGHVVAVVAAHYAAVDRYGSVDAARRAHLPLVVVMVAYTVLSLWIVSQPVVR